MTRVKFADRTASAQLISMMVRRLATLSEPDLGLGHSAEKSSGDCKRGRPDFRRVLSWLSKQSCWLTIYRVLRADHQNPRRTAKRDLPLSILASGRPA